MSEGIPESPSVEWFAAGEMDPRKFDASLLSPTHPVGKHKARLWRSMFGIGEGDVELLERLIRDQLRRGREYLEPVYKREKGLREDPSWFARL